ncbi:hypothetical protein HHL28_10650 [Aerophototrophica crusticola]|uniref:Uncharacterized protein n=1 Tax=Aerophototrophica crusticola TaxID=1709002 RepID=A0A858R3M8_9PROT|nr:hypothetical protein HHL28_10650 [Rhodospirillaceae bacterium B3]
MRAMVSVKLPALLGTLALLAAGPALAQAAKPAAPAPAAAPAAPPKDVGPADIKKAVTCQSLVTQFDDRLTASKAADDVKAKARDLRAAGNKACNAKDYDAGMEQVRQALNTIEVKPML